MRAAWRIGCAGWAIPRAAAARFPGDGSHLERYGRVLPAVEIDSSFYRYHEPATYARWAASIRRPSPSPPSPAGGPRSSTTGSTARRGCTIRRTGTSS